MKTKNIFIQTIAMIMCVITLSLSVGGKLCVYNNISNTHAADPFTVTMGSLALEEIILGIATAILGYEVVEQYHDDIIDSFKEYAKDPSMITDPQKNLFEAYAGTSYSSYSWEEYQEILQGMGSASKEKMEDYKDKFSDVFVRPCKEFIQYISDFYTRLFTDTPQAGDEGYIEGLSEYLDKGSIFENYEMVDGVYNWYFNAYAIDDPSYVMCLNKPSSTSTSRNFIVLNNNCLMLYQWRDSSGKSYNINFGSMCYINGVYQYDRSFNTIDLAQYSVTTCNMPIFDSVEVAEDAMLLFDYSSALNYGKSMDAIAIPGDDIPTVGNWDDLWERLKNPDLPWWFCNPDALGLANTSDLPWFDVEGLHDWAQDIPSIRDGIIEGNPDIPWTDVWDGVINIPDVVIPALDFPIVDNPAKPGETTAPTATPLPTPSPGEGIDNTKPIVDLSKFFPFCIPFDLIHLVQALDADPVAPKWTLKLEPPQFPVEWEVVLDLSDFESLAKIFRTGETLLFVVGLILITRGIIKG